MNNEHQPRHREESTEQQTRQQTADAYIADAIARAHTPEIAQAIADGYTRYGTPFAIYLALDGVTPYAEPAETAATDATTKNDEQAPQPRGMNADFTNAYIGFYWDRETLITDTIESFGWDTDLDRLLQGDPQLRAMVHFDSDEIWGFISDHYEIIDLDGGLYVFEQAP